MPCELGIITQRSAKIADHGPKSHGKSFPGTRTPSYSRRKQPVPRCPSELLCASQAFCLQSRTSAPIPAGSAHCKEERACLRAEWGILKSCLPEEPGSLGLTKTMRWGLWVWAWWGEKRQLWSLQDERLYFIRGKGRNCFV